MFSQTSYDLETYLDSSYIETDPEHAIYRRVVKNYGTIQNEYMFTDYYKSGPLKMVGKSKSRDFLIKKGSFAYYYENGKKKTIINYEESIPQGNYYSWYETGEKKEVGEYIIPKKGEKESKQLRIDQFWDENGNQKVIDGNGFYQDVENKTISNGRLVNGLKDSIWIGTDKELNLSFIEEYNNGKLIKGTSIDASGVSYQYQEEAVIKPKPKHGLDAFYRYIGKNLQIPTDINDANGKLFLSFVIEKDGKIGNVKVIRGIHPKLDAEAIKVLYNAALWEPGISRGKPCRVKYSIPINIAAP